MFPDDWQAKKLTIDHTKVIGSSNLTDYPLLITEAMMSTDIKTAIFGNSQGKEINSNYLLTKSSLKIYQRFENNALDETANNNDLTATGSPSYVTGAFGNAIDLEASSSQYLSIADGSQTGLDITSDITVSGIFNFESLPSSNQPMWLVGRYNGTVTASSYQMYFYNNAGTMQFRFIVCNGSSIDVLSVNYTPPTGVKLNLTVTWKASTSTASFYVNGVLIGTATGALTAMNNATAPFLIGAGDSTPNGFYDGWIDEVAVFAETLTEADIRAMYTGGADIRITTDSAGTTEIPVHIIDWDIVNQKCKVRAKVPTLNYDTATTLYIWYDNASTTMPARTATYGSNNVYPSTYKGSYPMQDNIADSTSNENNLTFANSPVFANSNTGRGIDLEAGSSQYLSRADDSDYDFGTGNFTIKAWVKRESLAIYGGIFAKMDSGALNGYTLALDNSNQVVFRCATSNVADQVATGNLNSTSVWYHVVAVRDATHLRVYINGTQSSTVSNTGKNVSTANPTHIGTYYSNAGNYYDGIIADVEVLDTALSADWIQTEYNNQNDPATFAVFSDLLIDVDEEVEFDITGYDLDDAERGFDLEGEGVGSNREFDIIGYDLGNAERIFDIKGTNIIPRRLKYSIIVKNSAGAKLGSIESFRNLKFSKRLNNYGSAQFELRVSDPKMNLIALRSNTIEIYREHGLSAPVLVWAGEQAVRTAKLDRNGNNWATIYCYTWFEQLRHRYTDDERIFTNVDQGEIAWTLIDESQTQTNGDLGITEGTIPTTYSRDRTYINDNIMDSIINLSNVLGGFDFEITDNKVFNVYDIKGEDKTNDIVLIYGKNVTEVEIVEDFSSPINRAIMLGQAVEETSLQRVVRNDSTSQINYKLREAVRTDLDVSTVETLEEKGDALLRKYKNPLYKVSYDLAKGGDYNITDFELGDGIRTVVKSGYYNLNEQFRIFEYELNLDENDAEKINLTLGNFLTI